MEISLIIFLSWITSLLLKIVDAVCPCGYGGYCKLLTNGSDVPWSFSMHKDCNCHISEGIYDSCKFLINHCTTKTCLNGGTCHQSLGSFYCICSHDFHGMRCELKNAPKLETVKQPMVFFVVNTPPARFKYLYIIVKSLGQRFYGYIRTAMNGTVYFGPENFVAYSYNTVCPTVRTKYRDPRICNFLPKSKGLMFEARVEYRLSIKKNVALFAKADKSLIGRIDNVLVHLKNGPYDEFKQTYTVFYPYQEEQKECGIAIEFLECTNDSQFRQTMELVPNMYFRALKFHVDNCTTLTNFRKLWIFRDKHHRKQFHEGGTVVRLNQFIFEEGFFDINFITTATGDSKIYGGVKEYKAMGVCLLNIEFGKIKFGIYNGNSRTAFCNEPLVLKVENLNKNYKMNQLKFLWKCNQTEAICKPRSSGDGNIIYDEILCETTYEFTLTVSHKTGKTKEPFTTAVTIISVKTAALKIDCVKNCIGKINTKERVFVIATETPVSSGSFHWSVEENSIDIDANNIQQTVVNFDRFITKVDVLKENTTYNFKVTKNGLTAKYTIMTNMAPRNGSCIISPLSGYKKYTTFTITCKYFMDDELPLKYEVYEIISANKTGMLAFSNTGLFSQVHLFYGDIIIRITDFLGMYTEISLKVDLIEREIILTDIFEQFEEIDVYLDNGLQSEAFAAIYTITHSIPLLKSRAEKIKHFLFMRLTKLRVYDDFSLVKQSAMITRDILAFGSDGSNKYTDMVVLGAGLEVKILSGQLIEYNILQSNLRFADILEVAELLLTTIDYHSRFIDTVITKKERSSKEIEVHLTKVKKGAEYISIAMRNVGEVVLQNLRIREEPIFFQWENSYLWAKIDDCVSLAQELSQNNHQVMLPPKFVNYYKKKQLSFMIIGFNLTPYWWLDEQLNTKVIQLIIKEKNLRNQEPPLSIGALKINESNNLEVLMEPISVLLDVKMSLFKHIFSGFVKFPPKDLEPYKKEKYLKTYQLRIPQGGGNVIIKLENASSSEQIRVCVKLDKQPSYKEVASSEILRREGISLELLNTKGIIYVGILPGPNESHDTPIPYSIAVLYGRCLTLYQTSWRYGGCQVMLQYKVNNSIYCQCKHLSIISAIFSSVPNQLVIEKDIYLAAQLLTNIYVITFLLIVFFTFIGILIWSRIKDVREDRKKSVIVFEDNFSGDEFAYIIAVYTGERFTAGTTSKIGIQIAGEISLSRRHILESSEKSVLRRGHDDWFLLLSKYYLGEIKYIFLWFNFDGRYPDWYCKKIMIHDMSTKIHYRFMISKWMSDIALTSFSTPHMFFPAPKVFEDAIQVFSTNLFIGLKEKHIWSSIFIRHPRSVYTRTQRIGLAFVFFSSTLLVSILFYGINENRPSDLPYIEIKIKAIIISIESIILSFVLFLIVILLFSKGNKWKKTPIALHITEKNKCMKFILSKFALICISTFRPITMTHSKSKTNIWIIAAWIVAALSIVSCWFFTLMFVAKFGYNHSILWFTSVAFAIVEDMFLFNPIRVVLLSIAVAFMFRKVSRDKIDIEANYKFKTPHDQFNLYLLHSLNRRLGSKYKPPELNLLKEIIIKKRKRERKLNLLINYAFLSSLFILIIITIWLLDIYKNNLSAENISYLTHNPGRIPGICFDEIFNQTNFFRYWLTTFLPNFHTLEWYNGKPLQTEVGDDNYIPNIDNQNIIGWVLDYNTKLCGVVRFRQQRLNVNGSQRVTSYFTPWYDVSYGHMNVLWEDNQHFEEGWRPYVNHIYNAKPNKPEIWNYSSIDKAPPITLLGQSGMSYVGGEYRQDLDSTMSGSERILIKLEMNNWLDNRTRVVFCEVVLYNVNVDLYISIVMIIEHLPSGVYTSKAHIEIDGLILEDNTKEWASIVCYTIITILLICFGILKFIECSRIGFFMRLLTYRGMMVTAVIISGILAVGAFIRRSLYAVYYYNKLITTARDEHTSMFVATQFDNITNALTGIFALTLMMLLTQNILYHAGLNKYSKAFKLGKTSITIIFSFALVFAIIVDYTDTIIGGNVESFPFLFYIHGSRPVYSDINKDIVLFWEMCFHAILICASSLIIAIYQQVANSVDKINEINILWRVDEWKMLRLKGGNSNKQEQLYKTQNDRKTLSIKKDNLLKKIKYLKIKIK